MREHVYDGMGGPFDDVPDAPEVCAVCDITFPVDEQTREVQCHTDGYTCSEACHAVWVKRVAERIAQDHAASAAFAEASK